VGPCTGAYPLAETGLLDGRPATVHWQLADDFRRRFPKAGLRPQVLFVGDGDILTSAGSAVALDLVAHRSGLGTTANLRAQMRRQTGLSRSRYRGCFAPD
jgi:transcriptional regulator GlxA family with amidase domain